MRVLVQMFARIRQKEKPNAELITNRVEARNPAHAMQSPPATKEPTTHLAFAAGPPHPVIVSPPKSIPIPAIENTLPSTGVEAKANTIAVTTTVTKPNRKFEMPNRTSKLSTPPRLPATNQ